MLKRSKLINLFMSGEIQMMPMQDFSPLLQPTLSHLSHVCTNENVLDRNLHKLRLGIIHLIAHQVTCQTRQLKTYKES